MFRILGTYLSVWSSEMDVGNVQRTQKLPSSSLGMNSRPSRGKSATQAKMGTQRRATASFGLRSAPSKNGA